MAAALVSAGRGADHAAPEWNAAERPGPTLENRVSKPTRLNCWKMKPMRMQASRTFSGNSALLLHQPAEGVDSALAGVDGLQTTNRA